MRSADQIRRPSAGVACRRFPAVLIFLILGTAAPAADNAKPAAPTLDHLYPVAAAAGGTTAVTAVGKFASWPPNVWSDAPGIAFRAGEKTGQFDVEVGPDVPAGPHLIRLFNDAGASAPRFLIVTAASEFQTTETEPNDEFAKAPRVEQLPVTINGRLNKSGDVDSFAIQLDAGQTLTASLDAYVLGSPVDPVLRLLDTRGLELAFNHDNGRTLDPALTWTAKAAGTYVLQVFGFAVPATADVRFTGSDACVYRLHLSRAAPASPAFPPANAPEWTERDHTARTGDQPAPTPPFAATGAIEQIGEQDQFGFAATKGDKLVLAIQSAALGLPLDAWLVIRNSAGKELVRNDDGTNADPFLEWTAPETGTYTAVVGSVLHRAGPDHRYRLSVQPAQPRFQGVIAESSFKVEPGKSAKIKVSARRIQGFKTKLTATVTGLPDGLTASPVELGEAAKEIELEITAAAEAPPFSGPIRVEFREETSDTVRTAIHELVSTTLRNGVPQGFRDLVITSTDQLWLTVLPAPPAKPAAENKAPQAGRVR